METLWVESEAAEVRAVLPPSSLFSLLASVSMAALHWSASWPTWHRAAPHRCYYDWEPTRPQRTKAPCHVGSRGGKKSADTSKSHQQIHFEQFREHFVEHLEIRNSKLPSGCRTAPEAQRPRSLLCLMISSQRKCKSQRGASRYKRHSSSSSGSCTLPLPDNVPTTQFNSRRKRNPIVFPAPPTPWFHGKLSYDLCSSGFSPWQDSCEMRAFNCCKSLDGGKIALFLTSNHSGKHPLTFNGQNHLRI